MELKGYGYVPPAFDGNVWNPLHGVERGTIKRAL
jgi:hypothetical protein